MLLARVCGHATATVKHASLRGSRLVLVQPLRSQTLEPLLVLDRQGAALGDLVVITSDGQAARTLVGDETSPARWVVVGLVDGGRADARLASGELVAGGEEVPGS